MFRFNNPVPSGLVGQPDLLSDPPPPGPVAVHNSQQGQLAASAQGRASPHQHCDQHSDPETSFEGGAGGVGDMSFAHMASPPDETLASASRAPAPAAGSSQGGRLPSTYRAVVEPAMAAVAPQQQQQQQQQQQDMQPVLQQQQQQLLPPPAAAASGEGPWRGDEALAATSTHASPRPRPRSANPRPLASPPRGAMNMEAVVQRSATRSGRPASARQLNPNSLAAKISGVQQPPEGAQVVQRDRQAFQQDYRGSADISARQRAAAHAMHSAQPRHHQPSSASDSGGEARLQPQHFASRSRAGAGPVAARPAWARPASPSGGGVPAGVDAAEAEALASQLNAQPLQQSPRPGAASSPSSPRLRPGQDGAQRRSAGGSSPLRTSTRPSSAGPRFMSLCKANKSMEDKLRQQEREEEVFRRYRVRQLRDDQPDFRYSQPSAKGPQVTLAQHLFSFDEAHPGIASQHYKRSNKQDAELQQERQQLEVQRRKAEHASKQPKPRSPLPSPERLRQDVSRLASRRYMGRSALQRLEQGGADIIETSRAIHRRALDAIAASQHKTKRLSRSPSPVGARAYPPSGGVSDYGSPNRRGSWSGGDAAWAPDMDSAGGGFDEYAYPTASPTPGGRAGRPLSAPFTRSPASAQHPYARDAGHPSLGDQAPRWRQQLQQQLRDAYSAQSATQGGSIEGSEQGGASGFGSDYAGNRPSRGASFQDPRPPHPRYGGSLSEPDAYAVPKADEVMERDRAVQASRDPDREGRSLADHLARASGVRLQGESSAGPAMSEQEFRLATGVFDPQKYEEYQRQMDAEMEQRALQAGYESDRERQEEAARAEAYANLTQEEKDYLEAQAREAQELEALMQQTWREQNSWMDQYRTRLGPYEGYGPSATSQEGQAQPQEEEVMEEGDLPPYLPQLSEELYREYGPGGTALGKMPPRAKGARPFQSTQPIPFAFEERAAERPKTIMQVKREQDREVKRMEAEAAKRYRFRAKPIPNEVLEPKYERMLLEAEATRQINREGRMTELESMMQSPFSFQAADEQRAAIKEAVAALAKNPNRFQIPFKAKPVPKTITEEKFKFMQLELERKRAHARARAEAARAKAREKVEMDMQARQQAAVKSYQERLRTVDPIWNQKYDTKPLGAVPDFNLLHMQWEQRMATLRALNRRRATVPREFHVNGRDAELRKAQEQKALERRQRIILDMALDEELLPEKRWPHMSARGRVRPTPPPAFGDKPDLKARQTRSEMLRVAATHKARMDGQYDPLEVREARAREKLKKDLEERAKKYVAKCKAENKGASAPEQGYGGNDSLAGNFGIDMDVGASQDQQGGALEGHGKRGIRERRKALESRKDAPVMHIEARHAQVEAQVRGMVEDALLARGVDAYNAYKYDEDN